MGLKPGEQAYCIDLFDDQPPNIDKSGEGDDGKFADNLKAFDIASDKIVCSKGMAEHDETRLLRKRPLACHFVKNVDVEGAKIPLISQTPRSGVSRLAHDVRPDHPAVFGFLRQAKQRMKGQVRTGHPKSEGGGSAGRAFGDLTSPAHPVRASWPGSGLSASRSAPRAPPSTPSRTRACRA